jgi:hypothetical protein
MSALPAREELINRLYDLNDEQVITLLAFVKSIQGDHPKPNYDPAVDPILTGELTFKAAPDFAEKSEDILKAELGKRKNLPGENP